MIRNLTISFYIANLSLLATHQVDAAFWHEWEMFGIPGGVPWFLLLNFLLMAIFLHGFRQLISGLPTGHRYALVLGILGIGAFAFHVFHLARGGTQFTPPVSIALLVVIFMVSVVQIVIAIRESRDAKIRREGSVAEEPTLLT